MGDGTQWMAGLGSYAYDVKKYRRIAAVSEDYSFPYAQVNSFTQEFYGKVPGKLWVPLSTKDYNSVIARLPSDVDALFVVLGGSDAVTFMSQYNQAGGQLPLLAGSITVDQSVLSAKGPFRKQIVGTLTAGLSPTTMRHPSGRRSLRRTRRSTPQPSNPPLCSPTTTTRPARQCCWRSTRSRVI